MSYRDENEALRARVRSLEADLARAEQRAAKLMGQTDPSGPAEQVAHSRLLGAPSGIRLERELPFEIGEAGYEAIAKVVRDRLGVQVSQVGHSLTTPHDSFSLTRRDGTTTIALRGGWGVLAGAPVAVGLLSGSFAAMVTGAALHDIAHLAASSILMNIAWVAPTVGAGLAFALRSRVRRQAERNLQTHRGVFEAVLELAEKHAVEPAPMKKRVLVEEEPAELESASEEEMRLRSDDRSG